MPVELLDMTDTEEAAARAQNRAGVPTPDLTLAEGPELSDAVLELSTKPLVLLEAKLSDAERRMEDAEGALMTARSVYDVQTQRYNFLTDSEAAAQKLKHLPALEEAERRALEAAEATFELARDVQAASVDREPTLSDADMQRANARQPFVKEDCQELPLQDLADKLRHAMQTQDTALCWLYQRYGARRVQSPLPADKSDPRAMSEVTALLNRLAGQLVDTRPRGVADRAKNLRAAALEFRERAGIRLREVGVQQQAKSGRYSF